MTSERVCGAELIRDLAARLSRDAIHGDESAGEVRLYKSGSAIMWESTGVRWTLSTFEAEYGTTLHWCQMTAADCSGLQEC
jgi:hypothetical protein